jgi:hypothetical protein
MTTKKKALISIVITIVLLFAGYVSLEGDFPTKMILLPGVIAEYKLAKLYFPTTIGIGGALGLFVDVAVSGAFWFPFIFAVAIGYGTIARCLRNEEKKPNQSSEPTAPSGRGSP